MKKFSKILICALVCALSLCFFACDSDAAPTGKAAYDASRSGEGTGVRMMMVNREIDSMEVEDFEPSDQKSDYVLIKVKDYGEIVVVLRRDIAPISVKNFKKLVSQDFYSGTVFHRIIEGFMIQGGGMTVFGDELKEKPAEEIKGEFASNGVENNLKHVRGVLAMARTPVPDSASSQFYIIHQEGSWLDGDYAAFGYVLAGMDVVDAIATCDVYGSSNAPMPVENIIIESATFVQPK